MNEHDSVERSLRRLAPAPLPGSLRERLTATLPRPVIRREPPVGSAPLWWRWLFPLGATAAAAGLLAVQLAQPLPAPREARAWIADEVIVDQSLVGSFDTITRLSNGLPVRVRCEGWVDEVLVRDSVSGVCLEQSRPRIEVFPVGLETY